MDVRGDERLFSFGGGNHPDYEIVLMFANEFKYVNRAVTPKKKEKKKGRDSTYHAPIKGRSTTVRRRPDE